MSRNQEGEYELVLGTPQILSIVFIIMVLMGVVFSLGYFMGRNVTPEPAASAPSNASETVVPDSRPAAAGRPVPPAAATGAQGEPLEPGQAKIAGTVPVAGGGTPGTPAQAVQSPAASAAPSSAGGEIQPAAEPPPAATPYPEPEPGLTFLQVAAVRRQEAELVVDVLKRKGFSARVAPGPSETLFRVLVGPLKDAEEIARTRRALEEAGFRSAYVRKY